MTATGPELPADQRLALACAGQPERRRLGVLLALDRRCLAIWAGSGETMLAALKLAWWREQCETIHDGSARSDPVLIALQDAAGDWPELPRQALDLVAAWQDFLASDDADPAAVQALAQARAKAIFAGVAGPGADGPAAVRAAGTLWALIDLRRYASEPNIAALAGALASAMPPAAQAVRPYAMALAMLARFAERDARCAPDAMPPSGHPRRLLQLWSILLGQR